MTSKKKGGPIANLLVFLAKQLGIALGGLLGILLALVLSPVIFLVSLIKGTRVVHADGFLCKGQIVALDVTEPGRSVGVRFSGPVLVRFSIQKRGAQKHVLGLALRMRTPRDEDGTPEVGEQDLILGTFESFTSLLFGNKENIVDSGDYLANEYDSVSPWRIAGLGIVRLRTIPSRARDPKRADSLRSRLDVDIAKGDAQLMLGYHPNDGQRGPVVPIAMLNVTSVSPLPSHQLRISLSRNGRNATAVGFRNGMRRIAYPVNQFARRIRSG